MAECGVLDCDAPVIARGWCSKHWQRWRKYGDPGVVRKRAVPDRLIPVEIDGEPHIVCKACEITKSLDQFPIARQTSTGRGGTCKKCRAAREKLNRPLNAHRPSHSYAHQRNKSLILKYGITQLEYDALLARQGGGCAICGSTEPGHSRNDAMPVDHDHLTGAVRGILCHHCNSVLGHARDSVAILAAAIRYLEPEE